jgi:hypothetical protein
MTQSSSKGWEVTVATDCSTVTDLLFNRRSFGEAVRMGRVCVPPPERLSDVRRLFEFLRITDPWYTQLADAR